MGIELSVIAPCFNEEENLPTLVERLDAALQTLEVESEIILVDDASRDRTRAVIEELAVKYNRVRGVFHEANQGIVGGWRSGLAASAGRYVVTIDADLQYAPEDVPRMYREASSGGFDLVQGWRRFSKDNHVIRYVLSVGLSVFLNVVFLMWLKDIKSGFVLYKREAFADILNYRGHYTMFQHFITIAAQSKGYRIKQIPVAFERRMAGESFITQPLRFSLRVLKEIPTAFVEYKIRGGR